MLLLLLIAAPHVTELTLGLLVLIAVAVSDRWWLGRTLTRPAEASALSTDAG